VGWLATEAEFHRDHDHHHHYHHHRQYTAMHSIQITNVSI